MAFSLFAQSKATQGYQCRTSLSKALKSEEAGVIHFKAVLHGTLLWLFRDKVEFGELIWEVDVYFRYTLKS